MHYYITNSLQIYHFYIFIHFIIIIKIIIIILQIEDTQALMVDSWIVNVSDINPIW